MKGAVELDRRQRLAACLMLSAVDLPAPAGEVAQLLCAAAKVCPGVTMNELPSMGHDSRRRFLERARDLIDEVLAEVRT